MTTDSPKTEEPLRRWGTTAFLVFFIILILTFMLFLIASVPKEISDIIQYKLLIFPYSWDLEKNLHLILIVVYGGGLGGSIHGLSSLATHSHSNDLKRSYAVWYLSRPFLGTALALAVYFAFRGGIITNGNVDVLNPYGVAAIAVAVGLGTKRIKIGRAHV